MKRNRVLHAAAASLVGLALLSGCQGANPHRFEIPFEYPSMGAGNEGVHDAVVLQPGEEGEAASDAILAALQAHEFSVVRPEIGAGEALPMQVVLETDYVDQPRSVIEEHNLASGKLRLDPGPKYGLAYRLQYTVKGKKMSFKVWSLLRRRGAAGPWHEISGSRYSGRYFAARFRERFMEQLRSRSRPEPGP